MSPRATIQRERPPWWGKATWTTKEAADFMGYTVRTLERWRQNGYGPKYHKLEGRTSKCLYLAADVVKFMRETPPKSCQEEPIQAA